VEEKGRTATYTAMLDSGGECRFGVGDMGVHGAVTPAYVRSKEREVRESSLVVCDGNMSQETVHTLMEICSKNQTPFFYEPTDIRKAVKPLLSPHHSAMTYCSPNLNELNAMLSTLPNVITPLPSITLQTATEVIPTVASAANNLLTQYNLGVVLVTLSECGVVLVRRGSHTASLPSKKNMFYDDGTSAVWYPCTSPCTEVVSVSGAGDCLSSGFISGVLRGLDQAAAVSAGLQAAKVSCGVSAAVPDRLEDIDWDHKADGQVLWTAGE